MIDEFLTSLNWLALVATFGTGVGAYAFALGRKWPTSVSYLSALVAFLAVVALWSLVYSATGFPGWMRWPTELLARSNDMRRSGAVYAASPQGPFDPREAFTVDAKDWQPNSMPGGVVYTCRSCDSQVQIQVTFGPEIPAETRQTNEQFIAGIGGDGAARMRFAESMMRSMVPAVPGLRIEVTRAELSQLGGLKVIQMQSRVEMGTERSHDNTMLAIHRNRIVKVTLNYFDGAMDAASSKKVSSFYGSLMFK